MELRNMPGTADYKIPRCGLLPMKESGFLSPAQVNMLADPRNLNGGRLQDIYAKIGSTDFPDPEVHEIFYKNPEHGGAEREVVFVDPLHCYGPRILVSLEAARAMHQGIAIMSRKVDSLFYKLRLCREDYFKELLYLREKVATKSLGMRHLGEQTSAVDGMAMWFNPPNYEDTLSIELLESRVAEVRDQWNDLCQEKQDEVNILKAKLSLTESKGGASDPKKMLAKMAKDLSLEVLLVIVRNATANHEAFYTAVERLIAQRTQRQSKASDDKDKSKRSEEKAKENGSGESAKLESDDKEDNNDGSSMLDAFLQSDFKRFKKEHDRIMESMNKARKREEDSLNKHEDTVAKLKAHLEAEEARLAKLQEQYDESSKKVKELEAELQAERSIWKMPTGKANRSASQNKKSTRKRMCLLASKMDELEDVSLRALAQSLQPMTRLSMTEELIMTMTAAQRISVTTTLRCCNAGGQSDDISLSNLESSRGDDILTHTETSRSSSPTHAELRTSHDRTSSRPPHAASSSRRKNRVTSRSGSTKSPSPHTPIDLGSCNSSYNNSPTSSPKTQCSQGPFISRSGSLASFGKLSSRAPSFEPMLEDLDEEEVDQNAPHISERTWRHLLESSCSDHRYYPGVRRRESLLSQPRSEDGSLGDSRRASNFSSMRPSTDDSHHWGYGLDATRPPVADGASGHGPAHSHPIRPSTGSDVARTSGGGGGGGGGDEQESPSDATRTRSSASSGSHIAPRSNSERLSGASFGVDRQSSRKTRRCNTTGAGLTPRKRLYSDCGAQTDDVGHDAVIRQLRADLVRANEYMPSSAHQKVIKRIVERVRVIKETRKVFVDLRSLHECVPTPFFPTVSSVKARLWSNGTQTDVAWDDSMAASAVGSNKNITVKLPSAVARIASLTPRASPAAKSSDAAQVGFQNSLTRILHRLSTQPEFVWDKSDATPKEGSSSDDNSDERHRQPVPPPSPTAFLAPGGRGGGALLAPSPMPGPSGPPPSPTCLSPMPFATQPAAPFLESSSGRTTMAPAAPDAVSPTMREVAWHPKRPILAAANMPTNMPPQPPPPSPRASPMPAMDDSSVQQQVPSEVPATAMARRLTRSWEPSLPDTKEETPATLSAQEAGAQVGAGDSTMTALRRKSSLLRTTATTSKLEIPARRASQSTRRSFTEMYDGPSVSTNNTMSGSAFWAPPHSALDEELAQVPEHSLAESPVDTNSSSYNEDRKTSASNSAWTSMQASRVGSPRSLLTSRHTSAFTSRRTSMSDSNFASRRVSVLFDELALADQQQRLKDAQRPSVVLAIPPVFDAPDSPEGGAVFDVIMVDMDIQTDVSVQGIKKALFDDQDDDVEDHNKDDAVREDALLEVEFTVDKRSAAGAFGELQHLCMNFLYCDQAFLAKFLESIGYAFQSTMEGHDDGGESSANSDDASSTPSSVADGNRAIRRMARCGMNGLQISKALLSGNNPLLRRRRVIGLAPLSPDKRRLSNTLVMKRASIDLATRRRTHEDPHRRRPTLRLSTRISDGVFDADFCEFRNSQTRDDPRTSAADSSFPPLPSSTIHEKRMTVATSGAEMVCGFQPISSPGSPRRRASHKAPQRSPRSCSLGRQERKGKFVAFKRAVRRLGYQQKPGPPDGDEAEHGGVRGREAVDGMGKEECGLGRAMLTEFEDRDGNAICSSVEAARQVLSDAVAASAPGSPSLRGVSADENAASNLPSSLLTQARARRATVRIAEEPDILTASSAEAASQQKLSFARAKHGCPILVAATPVVMQHAALHSHHDTPRHDSSIGVAPTSVPHSFSGNPKLRSTLRKTVTGMTTRGKQCKHTSAMRGHRGIQRPRSADVQIPGVVAVEELVQSIYGPKQ